MLCNSLKTVYIAKTGDAGVRSEAAYTCITRFCGINGF
jgi:hypothetical protein